jgi:stage II sporulation protein D
MRRLKADGLGAAALALILGLLLSAPASAEVRFEAVGHGFGHGVGMSQWGAYGFAKRGSGSREIATHYFRGTKIGRVKRSRSVRVLLGTDGTVEFSGSKRACGTNLRPGSRYRATVNGPRVRLERANGRRLASCGGKLVAKGAAGPIRIGGQGAFRGDLALISKAGTGYVINDVGVDDYVKGVIANEMPSSWPAAALGAQALAARSYALATDSGGKIFDQYDDTRSQVYEGLSSETRRTNAAVAKTARQVIEYRGEVIPAFFSSSSGGRTENVEFGFLGTEPKPYLRSVRDPYDDASPDHTWRETFSRAAMEEKLSGLVKGRLRGIRVVRTGASPRIVRAKVVGTRGTTAVTGADLQVRLGLRSTWVRFRRLG